MSDFDELIRLHMDPKAMAADALPEVVLHGGPKDGLRTYTHAPIHDEMRMPADTGIAALTKPVVMHIYQLDYVDGLPSLDDVGACQYSYVNTTVDQSR